MTNNIDDIYLQQVNVVLMDMLWAYADDQLKKAMWFAATSCSSHSYKGIANRLNYEHDMEYWIAAIVSQNQAMCDKLDWIVGSGV